MTLTSLQALTWGTVAGAVLSALLLAAGETGLPDWSRMRRSEAVPRTLPTDPPGATSKPKQSQPGSTLPVQQRESAR